jgi:hypothetical protein
VIELRLRRARQEARDLLRSVGAEREMPVPVEDIAHALGVDIVQGGITRALGSLVQVRDVPRIRLAEHHDHPGQVRFTIGHELGHLVLRHMMVAGICALQESIRIRDQAAEREADAFAAELLLPELLVRRRCEVSPVSLDAVRGIADDFGTSMVATAIRFVELTSERCAAVLSQDRRVRWAVRSATFWPEIARGQPLSAWSIADDYFAKGEIDVQPVAVDAQAWVDGTRVSGEAELVEHAMLIPQHRAVLSLLWIPESSRSLAYRAC